MIRIWHDDAMRRLPLWLTITMLNTSVLFGLLLWRQATRDSHLQPSATWLLLILWLVIACYIAFGSVRTRCHRIEMTLPIPSLTLWRRHLAAVFLAGSAVLAGSVGVLVLHSILLSRVGRRQVLDIPYMTLIGPLLAGLLLAVALVNSVEPGLQKLRGRRPYWALVLSSVLGIPLLLLLLIQWPLVSTGICLASAIVVSQRTERSLPAAFRLVPATAAPATAEAQIAASSGQTVNRWQVYRILFNILHNAPPWKQFTPWMVYGIGALMGFILGGGLDRWIEDAHLRFIYLPFGSYMLFAGIGVLTYNLFRLDSIPVARRTILVILLLPGLIAYCLGYTAGWWVQTTVPHPSPLVDFHVQQARVEVDLHEGPRTRPTDMRTLVWVEVDPSYMGMSLSGQPPILTTPWGESHKAWHEELFSGLPAIYYNPYNTSEETSPDFEALMLSRAIEDVYGQNIPPKELRDLYFAVEDERVVALNPDLLMVDPDYRVIRPRQGIPLREDYPQLEAPAKGPETAIYMALVLIPWLLLAALFLRSFRAIHSTRYIRGIYWVGLAIPMLGMMGNVLLAIFGLFSPEAGRGFLEILIRSLGASPVTWLLTWVVVLAAVLASLWLVLRQFERAEIPTSPINCSLVDWGKMD